jgi:hypothetical protein
MLATRNHEDATFSQYTANYAEIAQADLTAQLNAMNVRLGRLLFRPKTPTAVARRERP